MPEQKTMGEIISPVLRQIAEEIGNEVRLGRAIRGFKPVDVLYALDILMSVTLDVAFVLNRENVDPQIYGEDIANLITNFTTIDPRTATPYETREEATPEGEQEEKSTEDTELGEGSEHSTEISS